MNCFSPAFIALPWMQVQVKRVFFFFFVTAAQSQKSFINTLPPQVSMETSLATAHMWASWREDGLSSHSLGVCVWGRDSIWQRVSQSIYISVYDFTPYTAACAFWRSRACCRAACAACVHFIYFLLHVRECVLCATAHAFASVHLFACWVMFMQASKRADCRSACVCLHVSTLVCISKHTCSCFSDVLMCMCVCVCVCCFRMKMCEKQRGQLWTWILIRLNVSARVCVLPSKWLECVHVF